MSQIQAREGHRPNAKPSRHARVERQAPARVAAVGLEVDVRRQVRECAIELRGEAQVDGDILESVEHAGPFLERESVGANFQVQDGRPIAPNDAAVECEPATRRLDGQVSKRPSGAAALQPA